MKGPVCIGQSSLIDPLVAEAVSLLFLVCRAVPRTKSWISRRDQSATFIMAPAEEGARDTLTSSPSTSNLTAVESHGNSATAATKPQDKSTAPAKDEAEIERENIEAEREFADYGGDAPDPVRPAAQGRLSGGTDFGRRMTTRRSALSRRSTNYIDQKGEVSPHSPFSVSSGC